MNFTLAWKTIFAIHRKSTTEKICTWSTHLNQHWQVPVVLWVWTYKGFEDYHWMRSACGPHLTRVGSSLLCKCMHVNRTINGPKIVGPNMDKDPMSSSNQIHPRSREANISHSLYILAIREKISSSLIRLKTSKMHILSKWRPTHNSYFWLIYHPI